jgi:hypothetical protein
MATTTNYGFEVPDDTDLVKDGAAAMRELGQDVDTQLFEALGGDYPGLRLVKKQTIGTGVTTVVLSNVFSATYDAYKIVIAGATGAGSDYGYLKLGSSTSTYNVGVIGTNYAGGTSAANVNNGSLATYMFYIDANQVSCNVDVINPFLSEYTVYTTALAGPGGILSGGGVHKTASSYSDFTIGMNAGGPFTGGTIYVYGYGAS